MAEHDSPGPKPWEKLEVRGRDPHVVQVGTIREFLTGAASAQVKQEPPEGLQQCWEAQWQEFLKTMQAPHSGWKNPPLPQAWPKEESQEVQASSKGVINASRRPRGESVSQIMPGFGRETQRGLDSVKMKGEIPKEEEEASLETQRRHFREFCYWDAEGPREVCRQLQKRCRRWLKPERRTKEQMLELVTLEQFLAVLPLEMQSWVSQQGPETCAKAVAQAENFLTRLQETEGAEQKHSSTQPAAAQGSPEGRSPGEVRGGGASQEVQAAREAARTRAPGNGKRKSTHSPQPPPYSKMPEPLKEAAVSSPKLEHDPSDTVKLQYPAETKREVDAVAASILEAEGPVWRKKETFQPERVDISGISLGRAKGTPLRIPEMDKEPGSQQGSEKHQEDHSGKAAKQTFLHKEGDKDFHKSTFPMRIYECQTKTMAIDHGESHCHNSDLLNHREMEWKEKPYKCIYCEEIFTGTSTLITHLGTHSGERPYEYLDCGQSFSHLVSRERTHTAEECYNCSECGKSFSDSSYLRKHQRVHTGEKPYGCSQCGKSFSQRSVLWRHKRTHAGEKLHTCSDCGKGFCDKNSLSTHQRAHTGEKPFECSECGKRFGYAPNLARHKKLHTGEKPFQCLECGKHLCDKKSLIMHKRTHTGEKPYTCSECGKNFRWKGSLLIHEKTHTGEKPYQCSDCGKSFCDKQSLITHRRAHTGEKPYECSKCGKRFGYAPNLVRHKKLHTGEKPYQCAQCGKWFSQPSDLLRHETIHTREKPHKCTDCDKSFSQKASLIGHRRTHTGEKPYECSDCEKRFCSFSGFRKHQRIHTGVKT